MISVNLLRDWTPLSIKSRMVLVLTLLLKRIVLLSVILLLVVVHVVPQILPICYTFMLVV